MDTSYLDLRVQFCDGDFYAQHKLIEVLNREGCRDFVETGTYVGGTSLGVKLFCPHVEVWTTEASPELYAIARRNFRGQDIHHFLGDSVDVLKAKILGNLRHRPLFFLDAHTSCWNVKHDPTRVEYYPLRDELDAIAAVGDLNPIIVIHDFLNPYHTDFGYDRDHGVPLDWSYVRPHIDRIFSWAISYTFNERAAGNRNGIVYINATNTR